MLNPHDNRRWFVGTFGNVSVSPTFSGEVAASVGGTITVHDNMPPNLRVIGISVHNSALGGSSRLTFKIGTTQITSAIDTSVDALTYLPVDDFVTNEGDVLSASVTGGAVSGFLRVKVVYEMVGNL